MLDAQVCFGNKASKMLSKILCWVFFYRLFSLLSTVEPRYNEVLGDHGNYLVISRFSLYQGKKTKNYKELGPANLPCYKRVLLYPTSL